MQLNDKETHKLFIESVRYSLTRHSYAPSECADLIRSRWHEIPENTRVIIRRDLNEAIENDEKLASSHPNSYRWPEDIYQNWIALRTFVGAKYTRKRRSIAEVSEDMGSGIYFE